MWKCLLGCGLVVHNIDDHIDTMHTACRVKYPKVLTSPAEYTEAFWAEYYRVEDCRDKFESDYFQKVTVGF